MDDACRQVLRELQLYLDGESADELDQIISRHLDGCGTCHDRAEFHREVRTLLATKCTDCAPAGLMDRVRDRLWPTA